MDKKARHTAATLWPQSSKYKNKGQHTQDGRTERYQEPGSLTKEDTITLALDSLPLVSCYEKNKLQFT